MNSEALKLIKYLSFKMDCAREQEELGVQLDYKLAQDSIEDLEKQKAAKVIELAKVMPKVPVYKTISKPKNTHKKDGELSKHGEKWFRLLRENKLPLTHKEPFKVIDKYDEPNPGSTQQVKEWLFSLGWKPCTYKFVREDDGSERQIEQVRYHSPSHPRKGELCDSVLLLKDKEPAIELLEGITILTHRLGIFNGYINNATVDESGNYWIKAEIAGFTNTLRFKHKAPLVNLPGVDKPWGKEIRSCLVAPSGMEVVGADMVSLESTTKRHFIYPHDPVYAEEMSQEGFDEHVDLAVKAGEATSEQYIFYTTSKEEDLGGNSLIEWKAIHKIRKKFKPVNYSAVYGVGVPKLSRESGLPKSEAAKLLTAYWERNWAVKKVAEEQYVRTIDGQMWLKNPLNGFYYELRYDKDRFSTLNQGTGVYIFDSWLARSRARGYKGHWQFHDETGGYIKNRDITTEQMQAGVDQLNQDLDLNVTIAIDIKFGNNYAETH